MPLQIAPIPAHLSGETFLPTPSAAQPLPDHLLLDTCGGRVRVEWDPQAPVTPLGQLVFFTQFLETSGRFDLWVKDCPWTYGGEGKFRQAPHPQICRSSERNWMASPMWSPVIATLPARSAMVRATLRMRS